MDKKSRDNRSNQLNPNNPAYYKSREGNGQKVIVVKQKPRSTNSNVGFACPLCGKRGNFKAIYTGWDWDGDYNTMKCGYCGGQFKKYIK